ncbi:MAG: hypothetical protein LBD86_05365 [Spirochaetaceae bacterium]|jgi:hypothetical protein|nr:hypothetical protein [Spirochaetaceae bacterium]
MKHFFVVFCLAVCHFSFADETLFDTLTKPYEKSGAEGGVVPDETEAGDAPTEAETAPTEAETAPTEAETVSPETAPVQDLADPDGEAFDEKAFWENYEGPDIKVIYDERSEIDYVIVQTENEYTEFHYLDHIGYSDLIFVLTDMLKRITNEGYVYAGNINTNYDKNEEVALIYKINKTENTAYGIVQFPDFSVSVSAKKEALPGYPFNIASPNHMMALVYQFTMALAEVEQRLGIKQMEYTRKFFRQE